MPVILDVSDEDLKKQQEGGGLSKNTLRTRKIMIKSLNEYVTSQVSNLVHHSKLGKT